MNIGIDIDNVISNFDEKLLSEYLQHDRTLRGAGIVNPNTKHISDMFDWSDEEEKDFYRTNIERIAQNLDVIEGAQEYIDRLHREGHVIHIITGRDNGDYSNPHSMTKNWLQKHNISYDYLSLTDIFTHAQKAEKCKEYGIDIMIDDSVGVCRSCIENGIEVLLMDTPYNRYENTIKRVRSWEEIYDFLIDFGTKSSLVPQK